MDGSDPLSPTLNKFPGSFSSLELSSKYRKPEVRGFSSPFLSHVFGFLHTLLMCQVPLQLWHCSFLNLHVCGDGFPDYLF